MTDIFGISAFIGALMFFIFAVASSQDGLTKRQAIVYPSLCGVFGLVFIISCIGLLLYYK